MIGGIFLRRKDWISAANRASLSLSLQGSFAQSGILPRRLGHDWFARADRRLQAVRQTAIRSAAEVACDIPRQVHRCQLMGEPDNGLYCCSFLGVSYRIVDFVERVEGNELVERETALSE
jgi:hypothetical protein